MPGHERHRDSTLPPFVPRVDVHVGSADRRLEYADQNVPRTRGRDWDILERKSGPAILLDEREHGLHPVPRKSDMGYTFMVTCCRSATARSAAFVLAKTTGPPVSYTHLRAHETGRNL